MKPWRTSTRLPLILDALCLSEADPAVRRLAEALGGDPVETRERLVGEPARRSRRLLFASGGEIILHDETVVAVLLHLAPTAPHRFNLSAWIPSVDNSATLDVLGNAIGVRPHFANANEWYFTLDGGHARANFNGPGWKEPGNLLHITITVENKPGLACRPEDDDCPTCSDLLVRETDRVDVDGTIASLTTALTAGLLTEKAGWVKLADLQPLHASGLMERAESQLTCTACRRIICFTLFRDASPTFGYYVLNDAMRRPLEAIPPVDQWGDAARTAEDRVGMHYVDHAPGAWSLVERQGILYLQARYLINSMIDDSALIRLSDSEFEAYRTGGHDYLSAFARGIHDGSPHREESPYFQRNLYRGPDARQYREAVSSAIVNHTWLAEQRSP